MSMSDRDSDQAPQSIRLGFFKRLAARYWNLHIGSAMEAVNHQHRWFEKMFAEAAETAKPSIPRTMEASDWAEAVDRYRYAVPRLKRNYRHWAWQARAFLIGAVISLVMAAYRLWLLDFGGMFASLACVLLTFGFGWLPAWRSWQIRSYTLGNFPHFVRRPRLWWPPRASLPDEWTLYPVDSPRSPPKS